ncbi:MAG: hypothetical protein E3K32_09675 [wastewater metagenome]|nr:hypothetical protein [Candidatus Loosdrechtia aerotolerans]
MNKKNTILTYIQILVILCIVLFDGGIHFAQGAQETLTAEHQCGCGSGSGCKEYCCCSTSYGDQNTFRDNSNRQKSGFLVFISSVNCKYGNNPLTTITFTTKYIGVNQLEFIRESFLCFLFLPVQSHPSEIIASPPEKPPRFFI